MDFVSLWELSNRDEKIDEAGGRLWAGDKSLGIEMGVE